jgi:conjugative transposon TraN protein
MKKILTFLVLVSSIAYAQDTIEITFSMTTSLVFEYPIVNVDRGSKRILAQRVQGTENAIQVKAASKDIEETNLTVFTRDGNVHHFFVSYTEKPAKFVYHIPDLSSNQTEFSDGPNTKLIQSLCDKILFLNNPERIATKRRNKMKLSIEGVYANQTLIFYHLKAQNRSQINYDIESLRFFIRDTQQAKRTAIQDIEVIPVHVYQDIQRIHGFDEVSTIIILKKFTIPDAKRLDVELTEKDGGRNITLHLRDHDIMKARKIF